MKYFTLDEMKDSRIFFEKKKPRTVKVLATIIIAIVILGLTCSIFVKKNSIVKGQGNIQYSDRVNVSSMKSGNIVEIQKKEGERVEKGELLIKLSSGVDGLQSKGYAFQTEALKQQLDAIDIYERSLKEKKNYLVNSGVQQAYYGKIENYLNQLILDSKSVKIQNEKLLDRQQKRKELIDKLTKISQKETSNNDVGSIVQELKVLDDEISKIKLDINNSNLSSTATSIYSQLISELGAERTQIIQKKSEYESNFGFQVANEEQMKIYAPSSGFLHYMTPIVLGDFVQLGTVIATIGGGETGYLRAEVYVSSVERAKLKYGDLALISLAGLNQVKYGHLKGVITEISNSSYVYGTESGQRSGYLIIIDLESSKLQQNNNEYQTYSGLLIESSIIYDRETYLEWALEQLRLKE